MIENAINLKNVRLSFPALFEKRQSVKYPNKPPAYEATFILDKVKHAKEISIIEKELDKLLAENKTTRAKIYPSHLCLKDGDTTEREEFQGSYTLKSKSFIRPPVVKRDLTPVESDGDKERFYGGCYVNACIQLSYYSKEGRGVNAKLRGIQYVSEGEPFGEAPMKIEGAFEAIPEDASEQAYF